MKMDLSILIEAILSFLYLDVCLHCETLKGPTLDSIHFLDQRLRQESLKLD